MIKGRHAAGEARSQDPLEDPTSAARSVNPDNKKNMPPAQDRDRFETYSFTNNNDQKYLHKKFKKMASAFSLVEQQNSANDDVKRRELLTKHITTGPAESSDNVSVTFSEAHVRNPTALGYKTSSNILLEKELQNNVQIIFKDSSQSQLLVPNTIKNNSVSNEVESIDENLSSKTDANETDNGSSIQNDAGGRHVCPYCKLSCSKPSVLQKHIRAHTNERPYPCVPCRFAFKTKSNLYKHCRSRSHALRSQGGENVIPNNDDDWSLESESDASLPAASVSDTNTISDLALRIDNSRLSEISSPEISACERVTPPTLSAQNDLNRPRSIYKPKFHKASLYQDEEEKLYKLSPNRDFLQQHISKIISDNEAIVETIDSPLQKKYGKNSHAQRVILTQQSCSSVTEEPGKEYQPLNLTKHSIDSESSHRKRCFSESFVQPEIRQLKEPLNQEGSIIKKLLLKSKEHATGLLPVTSETYNGTEPLFICPLCSIAYRSEDHLEIHRLYYCKANMANMNLQTSLRHQDTDKQLRVDHVFVRSNSINVTLPETPSTISSAILENIPNSPHLTRNHKPEDLYIMKSDPYDTVAPLPSPGPLLGNTRLVDTRISFNGDYSKSSSIKPIDSGVRLKPLMSPRRRSDLIRTTSYSPLSRINDEYIQRGELYSPHSKIRCLEPNTPTLRSLEELSLSPMRPNSASLQMFGGEVKIVDTSGATTTLRIEPSRSQLSPTLISQSVCSPNSTTSLESETSNIVIRSGLHSGGMLVHNSPTPKEIVHPSSPQTPRIKLSITPNISTPNINIPNLPTPNITHFQFPPLGSITAFNPLTLPPLTPNITSNGPTTILHGGKLIPYVPGMPGPNTPSTYVISPTMGSKLQPRMNMASPEPLKDKHVPRINIIDRKKDLRNELTIVNTSLIRNKSPGLQSVSQNNNDMGPQMTKMNEGLLIKVSSVEQKPMCIPSIKINNGDVYQSRAGNGYTVQSTRQGLLKIDDSHKRIPDSRHSPKINEPLASSLVETQNPLSNDRCVQVSEKEMRHFNFESVLSKTEIYNPQMKRTISVEETNKTLQPLTVSVPTFERSETSYFKKIESSSAESLKDKNKSRFLRPSSLPLKPGTFTPKKHHGITPNANTMPLISPETPRPAKAYGQLYLNGHAYTYLGLKCSTKVYYCTLNRPQPTYVPNQHSLSMYSNWQICSEAAPHPLGLAPSHGMSLYDSRHRPQSTIIAGSRQDLILTHSSQWIATNQEVRQSSASQDAEKSQNMGNKMIAMGDQTSSGKFRELAGGFESNEEYTYVRGRGRGRYVCSECGIRCKKPSMLKKHIRTHTDVRPYTCKHCEFSFKTKGNLTKHMKSKAHYKKCLELGISPAEGADMQPGGDSDEDSDSEPDDGNEGETESSDTDSWKSRLPEHEAAHSLLSLWGTQPRSGAPGLLTCARPSTYPYTPATASDERETSDPEHNEPMDLSNVKSHVADIVTAAREPSVLASLANTAAKLPQHQSQWSSGEPMLHAYLTEKALQDSKIKQSQYTLSKLKKMEMKNTQENIQVTSNMNMSSSGIEMLPRRSETVYSSTSTTYTRQAPIILSDIQIKNVDSDRMDTLADVAASSLRLQSPGLQSEPQRDSPQSEVNTNTENAKFVASEYLKMATGQSRNDNAVKYDGNLNSEKCDNIDNTSCSNIQTADLKPSEPMDKMAADLNKLHSDTASMARNVVVVSKGIGVRVIAAYAKTIPETVYRPGKVTEDGRSVCVVCNKTFLKTSQLRLHINIHYMERPFRCSACAVSFRTKGHLQKHERSGSHHNKVSMTSTFGAPTSSNPRPFKCSDCKVAFRIHGHLAKHLRSKMHVMRLECLGKLPFGTFAEIERAGVSLTDIDTKDCANSLASLQLLAQKLHEKDPTKLEAWDPSTMVPPLLPAGQESSDEEDSPSNDQSYQEKGNDIRTYPQSEVRPSENT